MKFSSTIAAIALLFSQGTAVQGRDTGVRGRELGPKSSKSTGTPTFTGTSTYAPEIPAVKSTKANYAPLALYSTSPASIDISVGTDDSESLTATLPLGTVEGYKYNPTTAVVSMSVSTRIFINFDDFDDDNSLGGVGSVYLEILAFEGCHSPGSCSGVTPTVIAPGPLPVVGLSTEIMIGDNDDSTKNLAFTSTDTLQFVLAAPNEEDYFLAAQFYIYGETDTGDEDIDAGDRVPAPWVNGPPVRARKLQEADVDLWVDQLVAVITPAKAYEYS